MRKPKSLDLAPPLLLALLHSWTLPSIADRQTYEESGVLFCSAVLGVMGFSLFNGTDAQ